MAKEEHVALLGQGVDAWNAWRRENPDVSPDLRKADLRWAKLQEANLDGSMKNEQPEQRAFLPYSEGSHLSAWRCGRTKRHDGFSKRAQEVRRNPLLLGRESSALGGRAPRIGSALKHGPLTGGRVRDSPVPGALV